MPRLDRLPEANRKNLLTFPMQANDTAPFLRLTKTSPPRGSRS